MTTIKLTSADCPQLVEAERRHNRRANRSCDGCHMKIPTAREVAASGYPEAVNASLYWRVLRPENKIETFHVRCFEEEFGWSSQQTRSSA